LASGGDSDLIDRPRATTVQTDRANQSPGRLAAGGGAQWGYALVMSALAHAVLAAGLFLAGPLAAGRTRGPASTFRPGRSAAVIPQVFFVSSRREAERPPKAEPWPGDDEPANAANAGAAERRARAEASAGGRGEDRHDSGQSGPKPRGRPPPVDRPDLLAELARLSAAGIRRTDRWLEQLSHLPETPRRSAGAAPERTPSAPGPSAAPQPEPNEPQADRSPPAAKDGAAGEAADADGASPGAEQSPAPGVAQAAQPLAEIVPRYPRASIRRGEEGLVVVEARVLAGGRTAEARVVESSGHDRLDQAALEAVRRARFRPARRDGQAVASWVTVPIRFALRMRRPAR
jgi:protein TonB